MILVLLGTQNNNFNRLLKEVEKNIENGTIKEEVIVQSGFTRFKSDKMKILDLIPLEELDKLIEKASLIITHGGVGSIIDSLKKGKKIIAVPRLKKYKEHVNNHQIEIVEEFSKRKFLIGIKDTKDLKDAIIKSKSFVPEKYESNTENIINIIDKFIQSN